KEWRKATARLNCFWTSGAAVISKWTVPSFSGRTCSWPSWPSWAQDGLGASVSAIAARIARRCGLMAPPGRWGGRVQNIPGRFPVVSRGAPRYHERLTMETPSNTVRNGLPTRDEVLALLHEHTETPGLRKHALAVEAAMRAYASRFGEDPELWGATGL